jgi:hypothetical protein
MSGSTISTYVTHAVTVSPEGYLSPLLITKAGTIDLTTITPPSFVALTVNDPNVFATVTNDGLIEGNSAIQPGNYGQGGVGIALDTRTKFVNHGVIRGGAGHSFYTYGYYGAYPHSAAGGAGIAVSSANSVIIDSGKIYGGAGYGIPFAPGIGGAAIAEVGPRGQAAHLTIEVTRSGLVAGGYGHGDGIDLSSPGTLENAGTVAGGEFGGTAALMYGGTVLNRGTMIGGAAGTPRSGREGYGAGAGLELAGYVSPDGHLTRGFGVNTGLIAGGAGANGVYIGGKGMFLIEAVFVNHGTIAGGASGNDGAEGFGVAGTGVDLSLATISNFGLIEGGAGGKSFGGVAISADGGVILNSGTIAGGGGGAGIYGDKYETRVGPLIINTGLIVAGSAYNGAGFYGQGDGVYLKHGGTVINSGTITGAPGQDAVKFNNGYGNYASILVVENGAVFNGNVAANPADPDTLELAGTSPTALAGIGTQFTGFENIEFAKGSRWTIAGDTAGLASGQKITGFGPADAITLTDAGASSGSVSVATAGVVSIDAGGVISKLDIAGATVGETNFKFSDYTLTESAPAMAFLAPPATAAAPAMQHLFSSLDVLQHFLAAAPASFSHAGLKEAPMFGASLEQYFAPHIDAVPVVTLQA